MADDVCETDLRDDEVVCPDCHYTHYLKLSACPTCAERR